MMSLFSRDYIKMEIDYNHSISNVLTCLQEYSIHSASGIQMVEHQYLFPISIIFPLYSDVASASFLSVLSQFFTNF